MKRFRKPLLAIVLVLTSLSATVAPAGARWVFGISAVGRSVENEAVCADEISFSARLGHSQANFDILYPSEVLVEGVSAYPGGNDTMGFYATPADAIAQVNPVATAVLDYVYTGLIDFSHVFEWEGSIPTPAGYDNGDVLYVYSIDETTSIVATPLTVGDPQYDCADPEPDPLNAALFTFQDRVRVDSPYPYLLLFDARQVDSSTLQVAADTGTPTGVDYVGTVFGVLGFAFVDLNDAGVTCASSSLAVTGSSASGQPVATELPVVPVGPACA